MKRLIFGQAALLSQGPSAPPFPNTLTASQLSVMAGRLHLARHRKETTQALFIQKESIPLNEATEIFGEELLSALCRTGLFRETAEGVASNFKGQWSDEFFFLSDYHPKNGPAPDDYVLSIGPSAQYLHSITTRRAIEEALDLGCGCGVQTLFLARHAKRVTATDINPRCLEMTRLNAQLNGIDNIELLEGSYFEPVYGRQFDLIVANTPYVITPASTHTYRDALGTGDNMVLSNLKSLPQYLKEGGVAHMLITWLHKDKQHPDEPIRAITQILPVDTLLLHQYSDTPWGYAGNWIYGHIKKNWVKFLLTRLGWAAWYWLHGMERFAFGSVTLRKRMDSQGHFLLKCTNRIAGKSAGAHIQSLLDAAVFLQTNSDSSQYWQMVFRSRHLVLKTTPVGEVRKVSLAESLLLPVSISPLMGQLLSRLDGKRTLRQAYEQALRDGFDESIPQEQILQEACKLIGNGYLKQA